MPNGTQRFLKILQVDAAAIFFPWFIFGAGR